MSWRGILAGALALVALEAVVSSTDSAKRVGTLLSWFADLAGAAIDPSRPAIPDLAGIADGYGSGDDLGGPDGFAGGGGGGGGGGGTGGSGGTGGQSW